MGGSTANYYGQGYGTVFRVTTNGTLTTLVSFNGTNGANPTAALALGNDGSFYGMAQFGGTNLNSPCGTVFRVTTNGALTTLVSFNGTNGGSPVNGAVGGLVQGSDGNFYGTTSCGRQQLIPHSAYGLGTVFQVGYQRHVDHAGFFQRRPMGRIRMPR